MAQVIEHGGVDVSIQLHLLLQYFTFSQSRAHFLRQLKARAQTTQVLTSHAPLCFAFD